MIDLRIGSSNRIFSFLAAFLISGTFYFSFIYAAAHEAGSKTYFLLFDESMVSMQYAKNLAQGHGLSWNAFEPGITGEGFSSFLWTLWMSICHILSPSENLASLLVLMSGMAVLLGNLWIIREIAEYLTRKSFLATFLSMMAVGFYYPLISWTMGGVETGLLTFLFNSCILISFRLTDKYTERNLYILMACMVAAVLTRVDSTFLMFLIAHFVLKNIPDEHRKFCTINFLSAIGMTSVAYLFFRYFYFGGIVSNIYNIEVGSIPLLERLIMGLKNYIKLLFQHLYPLILFALPFFAMSKIKNGSKVKFLCRLIIFQSVYSILVGSNSWTNDNFPNQHIILVIPVLTVLSMAGLNELRHILRPKISDEVRLPFLVMSFLMIWAPVSGHDVISWLNNNPLINYPKYGDEIKQLKTGISIKRFASSPIKVATTQPGMISYYSGMNTIDLSGRNQKSIAKSLGENGERKSNPKVNLIAEVTPDLIVHFEAFSRDDFRKLYNLGYRKAPYSPHYYYSKSRDKFRDSFWSLRE